MHGQPLGVSPVAHCGLQQIEGFTADGDRYGIAFSAVADVADAGKICILEALPSPLTTPGALHRGPPLRTSASCTPGSLRLTGSRSPSAAGTGPRGRLAVSVNRSDQSVPTPLCCAPYSSKWPHRVIARFSSDRCTPYVQSDHAQGCTPLRCTAEPNRLRVLATGARRCHLSCPTRSHLSPRAHNLGTNRTCGR